ncbi:MAG TPA: hypothetical protein VK476_02350, partial [Flavobacterium sp.]|nr:hypothetical protein [Flavobacterium sp.]
ENIPIIQGWAEKHGLGRIKVTNQKDYQLICFFDDRAIQVMPNSGKLILPHKVKSMKPFASLVKHHLGEYKSEEMKITEDGISRNRPYKHILPTERFKSNILEPFRAEFWKYLATQAIKRHDGFHHLNSSQAACFNLFFPFIHDQQLRPTLLNVLGIKTDKSICQMEFEKIFAGEDWHNSSREGTNFDFYLKLSTGEQMFFEFKYSEDKFGEANHDDEHLAKLIKIYKPRLESFVAQECLEPTVFFKNYQLLRNVSYLHPEKNDRLFLVFPRENFNLQLVAAVLDKHIKSELRSKIQILHLEDFVEKIEQQRNLDARLKQHYSQFRLKYLPWSRC